MKKFLRFAFMLFFLAVFLFSFWRIWGILSQYHDGDVHYEELEQYVAFESMPSPGEAQSLPVQTMESPSLPQEESIPTEADSTLWPLVDFEALFRINPDIVAWLYIEGTEINYPVVQCDNNDFYLNHKFDRSYGQVGALFLDMDNTGDFSDRNSIIYGHNMKNGSMFAGLKKYKQQSYYETHPTALLITPTCGYKIHFFSAYVSDTWSDAWKQEFPEEEFTKWLSRLEGKSTFSPTFLPGETARILTLSTCTYEFANARFVVHGVITEEHPY